MNDSMKIYQHERDIEIEHNDNGEARFSFNGSEYYLNEIMRYRPGEAAIIPQNDGNDIICHGYMGLTNTSALVVRLSGCGDHIEYAAIIG
jgi:hypothetical protein